jgi:cell division septal protein FtsQ
MSEALAFRNYPRSRMSRSESLVNRILWGVVCVLGLFFVGELLFHLLIAPRLVLRNVRISTDLSLSKEEILDLAGVQSGAYYYSLDTGSIGEKLAALPAVKEVSVQKVFPDTLELTLRARHPLAILLFESSDGHSVPLAVDEEGVVFQIGAELTSWDLPVIGGVTFSPLRAGVRLPEPVQSLLKDLASLRALTPELFELISEVRLLSREGSAMDMIVYPLSQPVRLRLGPNLQAETLRNAFMVLDLLAGQGLAERVRELDLRTGEVVYGIEGDSPVTGKE